MTEQDDTQNEMPEQKATGKELITVNEFMDRFSISRSSFYADVRAKKLTLTKRGRRSYVDINDANAWKASLKRVAGPYASQVQ